MWLLPLLLLKSCTPPLTPRGFKVTLARHQSTSQNTRTRARTPERQQNARTPAERQPPERQGRTPGRTPGGPERQPQNARGPERQGRTRGHPQNTRAERQATPERQGRTPGGRTPKAERQNARMEQNASRTPSRTQAELVFWGTLLGGAGGMSFREKRASLQIAPPAQK